MGGSTSSSSSTASTTSTTSSNSSISPDDLARDDYSNNNNNEILQPQQQADVTTTTTTTTSPRSRTHNNNHFNNNNNNNHNNEQQKQKQKQPKTTASRPSPSVVGQRQLRLSMFVMFTAVIVLVESLWMKRFRFQESQQEQQDDNENDSENDRIGTYKDYFPDDETISSRMMGTTLQQKLERLSSKSSQQQQQKKQLQQKKPQKQPRVSYTLHRYVPYKALYQSYYRCPITLPPAAPNDGYVAGVYPFEVYRDLAEVLDISSPRKPRRYEAGNSTTVELLYHRRPLDDVLNERLNFTTTLHLHNLTVLVQGDSVGIQFSQMLQEALSASVNYAPNHDPKVVYRNQGNGRDSLSVLAVPTGGVVAGWRLTHLWDRQKQGLPLPNQPGGGWLMEDVHSLLHHAYNRSIVNSSSATSSTTPSTNDTTTATKHNTDTVKRVDALIVRIPTAWMSAENVTTEALTETVLAAQELLHVKVVIFLGLEFHNNIMTREHVDVYHQQNILLRQFVHKDAPTNPNITATVLLSPVDDYVLQLMKHNAAMQRHGRRKKQQQQQQQEQQGQQQTQEQQQQQQRRRTRRLQEKTQKTQQLLQRRRQGRRARLRKRLQQQQQLQHQYNGTNSSLLWIENEEQQDKEENEEEEKDPYFVLNSLKPRVYFKYQQSIPWICDSTDTTVRPGDRECINNILTYDGVHGCMESMSGRFAANWACLLACVFNDNDNHENNNEHHKAKKPIAEIRACERTCNDQFMSLQPIPDELFGVPLS